MSLFAIAAGRSLFGGREVRQSLRYGNPRGRGRLLRDAPLLLHASYDHDGAIQQLEQKGYKVDRELSTADTKVLVAPNGVPHVLHRGSKTANDWLTSDAMIAVGAQEFDPRLKKARDITARAERKYGMPANSVGHSLGGRLAEQSGNSGYRYTFNKAAGLGDLNKTLMDTQIDVRTDNDLVSGLSLTQAHARKQKTIKTGVNPVAAHSLDRL